MVYWNHLTHHVDTLVGIGMGTRPPGFEGRQAQPRDETNAAVKQGEVNRFQNKIFVYVADQADIQVRVSTANGDLIYNIGKANALMEKKDFYRRIGAAVGNMKKRLRITDKDIQQVWISSLLGQLTSNSPRRKSPAPLPK